MEKASQKEGMKVHPTTRPQDGQPSSPGWKGLALLVGAEGAKGREGSRPGASRTGQVGDLGPTFLYEMVLAQRPSMAAASVGCFSSRQPCLQSTALCQQGATTSMAQSLTDWCRGSKAWPPHLGGNPTVSTLAQGPPGPTQG